MSDRKCCKQPLLERAARLVDEAAAATENYPPDFPMPPTVIVALLKELADDIRALKSLEK